MKKAVRADRLAVLPTYFFHELNLKLMSLKAAGVDVIRLDMGSPDMPPAPFIIEALSRAAAAPNRHGYMPCGGTAAYRQAWAHFYARRFGVTLDADREVIGLIGSKEGIFNLALACVNPNDVVLVPDPGYAPYTAGALFAGGEVVYMPLYAENSFLPDLEAITPEVLRRTKLMWLNYPNNPTGATASLEFYARAVKLAHEYGFIIGHDAPYSEIYYGDYRPPSILQIPEARQVCLEFNSLSKAYNMAGWRVGVACGSAEAVEALTVLKSNIDSGSFGPILEAATAALTGDQSWLMERNLHYRRRRDLVVQTLAAIGLTANTPLAALYVWARLPADFADDVAYADALLEATGVSVTPGRVFGRLGQGYIRISLGTATERVEEAMRRWEQWAAGR